MSMTQEVSLSDDRLARVWVNMRIQGVGVEE